jgi:D-alanyl-D-alanine carboxypeptidase
MPAPHRMISPFAPATSRPIRLIASLALLATLAACGSSQTHRTTAHYNPSRYYPPPGPSSDPWGPYIHEASGRFGVPENWVRRVMRQESGGQEDVISWAGAMGLMQVMPETYAGLRDRYNLGDDPFDPHNNILAGTAYLREMYDRFGSPGFLAAYNAGPNRLDQYLANGTPLPTETVNYVASIAPLLGSDRPMSGPLAVYAGNATVQQVVYRPTASGCDPDAAYNPDGPCTPLRPQVAQAQAPASYAASPTPYVVAAAPYTAPAPAYTPTPTPYASTDCDPDAAYDPSRPCHPAPPSSVVVAEPLAPTPEPRRRCAMQRKPARSRSAWPSASPSRPSRRPDRRQDNG